MTEEQKYIALSKQAEEFDDDLSLAILWSAFERFPHSKSIFSSLVSAILTSNSTKALEKATHQYRKANGEDYSYLHSRGVLKIKQGQHASSIPYFEKSFSLSGDTKTLAEVCMQTFLVGNTELCASSCNKLMEISEDKRFVNFMAHFILALVSNDTTITDNMIRRFEQVKLQICSVVFRNFAMRTHSSISEIDDKQGLERAIRSANVAVSRPTTFIYPEDGDGEITLPDGTWIIKPAGGRGGKQTRIVPGQTQIQLRPEDLCQAYIDKPYLLFERKFHIRVHIVFPNLVNGQAFLYHDGMVRLAPEKISSNYDDLSRHITNTALHNVSEPEQKQLHQQLDQRIVWTLTELFQYLGEGDAGAIKESLQREVANMAQVMRSKGGVVEAARSDLNQALPLYLGFDFIIDENCQAYLLELQKLPSLEGIWPMKEFIDPFFSDMFDLSIDKPENHNQALWLQV